MSAAKLVRSIAEGSYIGQTRACEAAWIIREKDMTEGDMDEALHTAADVLEALAVPGVAKALRLHAEALDDTGDDQVAAALRTLADAAKGTP